MQSGKVGMPRWVSTLRLMTMAWAWALAMVLVGVLAMLEWPGRIGSLGTSVRVIGAALIAGGMYTLAFFAARIFPLASRKVTMLFEMLPWIVLGFGLAAWSLGAFDGGRA